MSGEISYEIRLLVMKVAEGDESAFRTIFDRYKSSFYTAACKMTRSPHQAEEIVQEVFITFWNNRQLVADSRHPEHYLKKILYNSIYSHFKKITLEKQMKTNLYQAEEPYENMVEEILLSKENFNFLNSLVSKLPPQQRLVYQLSKQEGMSREEIASRLNISPNTVRNHLSAAVQFISSGFKKRSFCAYLGIHLPNFLSFFQNTLVHTGRPDHHYSMMNEQERIVYLLELWSNGSASREEERELFDKIKGNSYKKEVEGHIGELLKRHDKESAVSVDWEKLYSQILDGRESADLPSITRHRLKWYKWTAAAAVLIIVSVAVYWLLPATSPNEMAVEQTEVPQNDIAPPTTNKATLTLPGGKIIELDNIDNGSLALAGAKNASKESDGLLYADNKSTVMEWHTLANPKGSKPIHLELADGSQVWLNAASSVTFPTIFNEPDRKVAIKGEGYFEIAKNTGKKFIVTANGTITEVLGTHFNINAYENEPVVRITLLEGAINTTNGGESAMLRPGQQANFSSKQLKVLHEVDIEEVMAWKENMFEFNDTDIQSIMRQIERWYDVDVSYNDDISLKFNGSIQRQVNVSRLLDMLEKTRGVRFKIENKRVLVNKY